jgi:uncharacterized membrane protein YfcA
MFRSWFRSWCGPLLAGALLMCITPATLAADAATALPATTAAVAWWVWPLGLFVVCFLLGIVAVPAGVGGGVLFVPIVGGFFPFHLDFVRGAGLLVALAGALSAGPDLLRAGYANLRLALPLALVASASSIVGALIGLAMPARVVNLALGTTILGITVLMLTARKSEWPVVVRPDRLSQALAMHGIFRDAASGREVAWQVHRTPLGLLLFLLIGVLAGMFGLGAGWANVPVPSVVGMMLGAQIGARLLKVVPAALVRKLVIGLLLFAGLRAFLKGLQVWN